MHYVWLTWSSAFLLPWVALYAMKSTFHREMLRVSLLTSLLGFSEPIFVPTYWNPPSLFDLAQRTGFDIESLIFCFAIGGICAVAYNVIANRKLGEVSCTERHSRHHRWHHLAISAPFFPLLVHLEPLFAHAPGKIRKDSL